MADQVWDASTNTVYTTFTNYVSDAGYPGDGDKFTASNQEGDLSGNTLPRTAHLATGTVDLDILAAYDDVSLTAFLGEEGVDYGVVLVDSIGAIICGDISSTSITITAGEVYQGYSSVATDVILNGGLYSFRDGGGEVLTGGVTDTAAGTLYIGNDCTVSDLIDLDNASTLEIEGGATLTAPTGVTIGAGSDLTAVDGVSTGPRGIKGDTTFEATSIFDISVDDEDFTFDGDWTGTNCTFAHIATGTIICTGSWTREPPLTVTHAGTLKLTGSGKELVWAAGANWLYYLSTGASYTLASAMTLHLGRGLTMETGSTFIFGGRRLRLRLYANDVIDIQSGASITVTTGRLDVRPTADFSNSGRMAAPRIHHYSTNDTLTQSGVYEVEETFIYGESNDQFSGLILSGTAPSLGDVTLGHATTASRTGRLTFSGDGLFTTGSLNKGAAASTTNQLNLGSRNWTLEPASTVDGTGMVCTATGGNAISGDSSCEIKDCVFDNEVFVYGEVVEGTGNTNVTFVHGVMTMMGLG